MREENRRAFDMKGLAAFFDCPKQAVRKLLKKKRLREMPVSSPEAGLTYGDAVSLRMALWGMVNCAMPVGVAWQVAAQVYYRLLEVVECRAIAVWTAASIGGGQFQSWVFASDPERPGAIPMEESVKEYAVAINLSGYEEQMKEVWDSGGQKAPRVTDHVIMCGKAVRIPDREKRKIVVPMGPRRKLILPS